jgi:hypothetical protein
MAWAGPLIEIESLRGDIDLFSVIIPLHETFPFIALEEGGGAAGSTNAAGSPTGGCSSSTTGEGFTAGSGAATAFSSRGGSTFSAGSACDSGSAAGASAATSLDWFEHAPSKTAHNNTANDLFMMTPVRFRFTPGMSGHNGKAKLTPLPCPSLMKRNTAQNGVIAREKYLLRAAPGASSSCSDPCPARYNALLYPLPGAAMEAERLNAIAEQLADLTARGRELRRYL